MPPVEPVYGLTEGLYPRTVQKAAQAGLARLPASARMDRRGDARANCRRRPSPRRSTRLHNPLAPGDVEPTSPAASRLAYDELLANQLALLLVRARMRALPGRAHASEGRIAETLLGALPYQLTGAQARAIGTIRADLAAPQRMIRLLQGDVGSGKTIVALIAMAHVVEGGRQAALMAPTEILARQHFERMKPLGEIAGLRLALFTGRDTAAMRRAQLAALAAGEIDIAVGTHALFQESVEFRDLGLAVVDEQHRFGVHQRLALASKGETADLLVMTATPIPRTLVLTYFGDMDVSALDEKPPGRTPIDTRALPIERLDEVVAAVGRAIAGGARAYWVCPLVEESEALDVAAAEERAENLRAFFGDAVGLVHGRMKGPAKDAAMERFQRGETKVLVATTVIEVGVDVPEATIMVIEHAERFGLAQTAPIARPRRARRRPLDLPPALQGAARRSGARAHSNPARDRGRFPHRRRGPSPARRRRRARRASGGSARFPPRAARSAWRAAAAGARPGGGGGEAERAAGGRGVPGAPDAALSVRARRGGEAAGGGLKVAQKRASRRIGAPCSGVGVRCGLKTRRFCAIYGGGRVFNIRPRTRSGELAEPPLHAGILVTLVSLGFHDPRRQDRPFHALVLYHPVPSGHWGDGLCRGRTRAAMVRLLRSAANTASARHDLEPDRALSAAA